MRTRYVIVGTDIEQKQVVLGDRLGLPFVSESAANNACTKAKTDFFQYEFVVIPVQAGPR